MQVVSLFPTPVGIFKLDREFTKSELDFIYKSEKRPNMGNITSVDSYIFNNKKLNKLHKFCLESAAEYMQKIVIPKYDIELYITQSWLNYTEPNHYHHKHSHPNSFLSGVLYISADETNDRINFHNDQQRQIELPTDNFNQFNSKSWWIPVESGKLIIFPSHLSHSVDPVQSEKTRISLAFNTFIKGNIGEIQSLTELIL